jgi:hypothetical protein
MADVTKDSAYYKKRLIRYFASWGNQYVGAVFEAPNLWSADVVACKYGGRFSEYEIKVSRADLLGEIAAIRRALEPDSITIGKWNNYDVETGYDRIIVNDTKLSKTKIEKHHHYLVRPRKSFRPNQFYFVVPAPLVDVAVERTAGLKYGVFNADALTIVKKAMSLHFEEHATTTYVHMLNRMSVMYRDIQSGEAGIRYDVLYRVAKHYGLDYGSVGYMRLMEVMKEYQDEEKQ